MTKKVGVDMGGTWLRVGIVETDGQITRFMKHPRPAHWEGLVSILTHYDEQDIKGFGVALSGPIANHASVIKGPNIPWLEGRNVRKDLQTALGKRVVVSNDMEATTEGEIVHGALRRFTWAVFETISTGWGGNLIL